MRLTNKRMMINVLPAIIALSTLFITACTQGNHKPQDFRQAQRADFSGNWEMDYSLNDSAEAKLQNYFYRLRKAAERQNSQRRVERQPGFQQGYSNSAATLLAMAQFVERITRTTVMDIDQTYNSIHIDREDSFSLDCQFGHDQPQSHSNRFGQEVCGWDGHQLVFHLRLPEGMTLQHRLTLSSDGQQMNVATTVNLAQAPEPFTLNRAYMRFDGVPKHYKCEQTVSRGKVCSLVSTTKPEK